MKKNTKKMAVIGLIIGCLTIGGVSAFALTNGTAYQDFKNAAMLTMQEKNMTVTADVSVRQDGAVMLSGDTVMQMNDNSCYSNSTIQIGGEVVDMERSGSNGTSVTRIGDEYTKTTGRKSDDEEDRFCESPNAQKLMEMVTDLMVGDVKTHFYSNGDTVTVNLDGAQIPELLNVAASAAIENSSNKSERMYDENELFGDVFDNLNITQDVQITRISMESQLKDGYLENTVITMTMTGKDNNGATHEIEMTCNAAISDIGSTTAGVVNTDGKTVTEIEKERYHR